MTETWKSLEAFSTWHYAKDFTHVSFFHEQTFDFIAEKFGSEIIERHNDSVMILRKKILF